MPRRSSSGARRCARWRGRSARSMRAGGERLVRALASLEAHIDFPDEDLPPDLSERRSRDIAGGLQREIGAHLADNRRGERLREGSRSPSSGAPNAGKSSLLNCLAGRDAAIVSAARGHHPGRRRSPARSRRLSGDLPTRPGCAMPATRSRPKASRRALGASRGGRHQTSSCSMAHDLPEIDRARWRWHRTIERCAVVSKIDLPRSPSAIAAAADRALPISVKPARGSTNCWRRLGDRGRSDRRPGEAPPLTRARHRAALEEAVQRLDGRLAADGAGADGRGPRLAVGRLAGSPDGSMSRISWTSSSGTSASASDRPSCVSRETKSGAQTSDSGMTAR